LTPSASARRPRALALLVLAASALAAGTAHAQVVIARPQLGTQPPNLQIGPTVLAALALAPPMNLTATADALEARFKGHSAGYAFAVSYRDQVMVTRAGGMARRAPDAAPRAMTADEHYNIASVSKTITAAALMQLLSAGPRGAPTVDSRVVPLLPSSWRFGPGVQNTTIRQLLTHRSGIRCGGDVTYDALRQCLAGGVQDTAVNVWKYNNANFALFRLVIARLSAPNALMLNTPEGQASFANTHYMGYVRQHVLAPAGIPAAVCHPIGPQPGQAYQFPGPIQAGTDFGPMDERCGSQGWNLSARELGRFVGTLLYTDKILPAATTARMRSEGLGLYTMNLTPTVWATGHNGYYPGKTDDGTSVWNAGQISTVIVGLGNGVSVAVIVNSQIDGGGGNWNAWLEGLVKDTLKEQLTK
jgi:CubicO group peptidase (beta-lactamase class C family)